MQRAEALRGREVVAWLRKVVHADVPESAQRQAPDRQQHQVEPRFRRRHLRLVDAALWLEDGRQMRIVVERDAVRVQDQHLVDRLVKPLCILLWQPVDEIHVHGLEARRPCGFDDCRRLLVALDPVDRALNARIEVLHADRDAVEADLRKRVNRLRVRRARIDLDGALRLRIQLEMRANAAHELTQLLLVEKRRRASAPVQLIDTLPGAQGRLDERHLSPQIAQILRGAPVILGDDLVAGAVVADRAAKRQVHV